MHSSRRRRSLSSISSSFSSFSSNNSYIPTYRRSSPGALRQLVVRDLAEANSTDLNQSSTRERESIETPRPTLPIPRPSVYIPRNNNSVWTTDRRPIYREEISSLPNRIFERPFYQILPRSSTPPQPPPPPPPPPPIQYQIVPVPFQQPSPIRRTLRRIKPKKYFKEKTPGFCTTLCSGGFATLAAIIYLIIALALPTSKLILGIIHINNCPINKNIPLYMIVSGACGLSIILFLLLSSTCKFCRSSITAKKSTHKFMICTIAIARGMQGVLAIFLFIWFFIGNFWVFGARSTVQTDKDTDSNYCHPALYWFAFYVLIFTYVYAIFICFAKFCTTFLCCGACDIWKRAFS